MVLIIHDHNRGGNPALKLACLQNMHKRGGGITADEGAEVRRTPRHSIRVLSRGNLRNSTVPGDAEASTEDSASSLGHIKLSDGRGYWCNDREERITSSHGREYQRDHAGLWSSSSSYEAQDTLGDGPMRGPNNYSKMRGPQLN